MKIPNPFRFANYNIPDWRYIFVGKGQWEIYIGKFILQFGLQRAVHTTKDDKKSYKNKGWI